MFGSNLQIAPTPVQIAVRLEPVVSILNIISLPISLDSNPGIRNWLHGVDDAKYIIERTSLLMSLCSPEALIMAVPDYADNFPDFLEQLAALDAIALRDCALRTVTDSVHLRLADRMPQNLPDLARLLADEVYFLDYLRTLNSEYDSPPEVYLKQIHAYLNDPPRLKTETLTHLRQMWTDYVAAEWQQVLPTLEKSVQALSRIDTHNMPIFDALQAITGRNLRTLFNDDAINQLKSVVLVPSVHNGPYVSWMGYDDTVFLMFGARVPADVNQLDATELINRLNAIADETRLNILQAIKTAGELSTQDVIDRFNLDKSAASRHLMLLRANELIYDRRENKVKYYSLNPAMIDAITQTLTGLLG